MKKSETDLEMLAALQALGALTPPEEEALACLLAADESSAAMVEEYREAAALLSMSLPPVPPPQHILEALLKVIATDESDSAEPQAGIRVVDAAAGWRDHQVPGLRYKELARDELADTVTLLMTLEPGTVYPAHDHIGPEQCLVMSGSFQIGDTVRRTGDFIYAEAGTSDGEMNSVEGATLFVVMAYQDFARAN